MFPQLALGGLLQRRWGLVAFHTTLEMPQLACRQPSTALKTSPEQQRPLRAGCLGPSGVGECQNFTVLLQVSSGIFRSLLVHGKGCKINWAQPFCCYKITFWLMTFIKKPRYHSRLTSGSKGGSTCCLCFALEHEWPLQRSVDAELSPAGDPGAPTEAFGHRAVYHTTVPWVSQRLLNMGIVLVSRKLCTSVLEDVKLRSFYLGFGRSLNLTWGEWCLTGVSERLRCRISALLSFQFSLEWQGSSESQGTYQSL